MKAPATKQKLFYGYVIVPVSFFLLMMVYGLLYSYGVFVKPMASDLGLTRAATSGAYSVGLIVTGFLYMLTGRINDKFGARVLMTLCGLFVGAGCLLMSTVQAPWQLYLFWGGVLAIGQSGGIVPITSTIAKWFVRRRGLMTGVAIAGIGFGEIILPPLITILIGAYGWRQAFAILGVAEFVILLALAQFLRRDPAQVGQLPDGAGALTPERAAEAGGFSLPEALANRQFWILTAGLFTHGFVLHATFVHMVPHATDLGIAAISASSIMAFIGGLSIFGRIGLGNAGDRIGNRTAYLIAYSLTLVSLLWVQVATNLWMFYLFAAVFGLAYGGEATLMSPIIARLFGLRAHGAIYGIIFFGISIGGAIGPYLAGKIFDLTGRYQTAFWLSAGVTVLSIILTAMLRPTRPGGSV